MECRVTFNETSEKAYKSLPGALRLGIAALQGRIEEEVLRVCPNAQATSGYRDSVYNRGVSKLVYSKHLWGLARDYSLHGFLQNVKIPGFRVVYEKTCVHVEFEGVNP